MQKPWKFNSKGQFIWERGRDKKLDGTIFVLSPYAEFFKRNEITESGGMISVPPFWAWNCTSNKTTPPNSVFKFKSSFLVFLGLNYHCSFIVTLASLHFHSCNFDRRLINVYKQTYICEIKNTNVFKHIFLIRKVASQNFFLHSNSLFGNALSTLLCCWQDSRKTSVVDIIFNNLVRLLLWIDLQTLLIYS